MKKNWIHNPKSNFDFGLSITIQPPNLIAIMIEQSRNTLLMTQCCSTTRVATTVWKESSLVSSHTPFNNVLVVRCLEDIHNVYDNDFLRFPSTFSSLLGQKIVVAPIKKNRGRVRRPECPSIISILVYWFKILMTKVYTIKYIKCIIHK